MATLEIARNAWWNKFTREEQEQYLKDHPRSRLKITKRKKKNKQEQRPTEQEEDNTPSVSDEPSEVEKVAKETVSTPAVSDPKELVDEIPESPSFGESPDKLTTNQEGMLRDSDKVVAEGDVTPLNEEERNQAAEELTKQADRYDPTSVMDKLSDEDKQELEDDLQDAIGEEDDDAKEFKFGRTALKLGLKLGLITAGVLLVGSVSPMVLFLPQVHGSIWQRSTDWSERGSSALFTGLDSLHKVMKKAKKLAPHISYGVKAKTGGE